MEPLIALLDNFMASVWLLVDSYYDVIMLVLNEHSHQYCNKVTEKGSCWRFDVYDYNWLF